MADENTKSRQCHTRFAENNLDTCLIYVSWLGLGPADPTGKIPLTVNHVHCRTLQRNSRLSIPHFPCLKVQPPRHPSLLLPPLIFFLEFADPRNLNVDSVSLNFCPLRDACRYICKRGVYWRCMGRRSVIRYNFFRF